MFYLNAGSLPAGEYTWKAKASSVDTSLFQTGVFYVSEVLAEFGNAKADFSTLYGVSGKRGKVISARELNKLGGIIRNLKNSEELIYITSEFEELIRMKWMFGAIAFLLSMEWFVRRNRGSY